MAKRLLSIDPNQPLDHFERTGVQLSWPRPVSHRLDQLVEQAHAARTDRSELAAAIVCAVDYTESELSNLLLEYRGKTARDAICDVDPLAEVVELPRHGVGRRGRNR